MAAIPLIQCSESSSYGDDFISTAIINCSQNQITYNKIEMDTQMKLHIAPHDAVTDTAIDTSIYPFPQNFWYIVPKWEIALKLGTFIPIILIGCIGNILLIIVILRNRGLRTATNLLIANMALADFLTLLICPTLFMIHDFYQNYELGSVGCKMEGFLEGLFLITSVLNLIAVSYDRLTAIVLPQEAKLTVRGVKFVIAASWVIGILMALPLLIYRYYRVRVWLDLLETYCTENISVLPMYWHVIITTLVWFPLAVMVICYSAIFWKLDRYEASVLKREHPISVSYKKRVAKMLFIVLATFIILRFPYTALIFHRNKNLKNNVMNSVDGAYNILWYISHYLMFFNAAINPIIYGLTNDNFRRAFNQWPLFNKLSCCKEKSEKSQLLSNHRPMKGILAPQDKDEKSGGGRWFNFTNMKSKSTLTTQSTLESPRSTIKSIKIISTTKIPDDDFYHEETKKQVNIANDFI